MKSLVILMFSIVSCRADIVLEGIVSFQDKSIFALTDTADGSSEWLGIDGVFHDYTIKSFDRAASRLVLRRDNRDVVVLLSPGKITKNEGRSYSANDPKMELVFRAVEAGDPSTSTSLVEYQYYITKAAHMHDQLQEAERLAVQNPNDKDKAEAVTKLRQRIAASPKILAFLKEDMTSRAQAWTKSH